MTQELLDFEKPCEKVRMIIRTDSDAAKGVLHRVGCGRVRHQLAKRYLRHQEALRDGLFEVERVNTKDNATDLGTKMLHPEATNRCKVKFNIKSRAVACSVDDAHRASVDSACRSEWTQSLGLRRRGSRRRDTRRETNVLCRRTS